MTSEPPSQLRGETESIYLAAFAPPAPSYCHFCRADHQNCGCVSHQQDDTNSVGAVFGFSYPDFLCEPLQPGLVSADQRYNAIQHGIFEIDGKLPWMDIDTSPVQLDPPTAETHKVSHPHAMSAPPPPYHHPSNAVGGTTVPAPPRSPSCTSPKSDEHAEHSESKRSIPRCEICRETFSRKSERT